MKNLKFGLLLSAFALTVMLGVESSAYAKRNQKSTHHGVKTGKKKHRKTTPSKTNTGAVSNTSATSTHPATTTTTTSTTTSPTTTTPIVK